MQQRLDVLVFKEGRLMVARCLQYDIAAQGETIDEALAAWEDVFTAQILVDKKAGREPLAGIGPAPQRYFDLFKKAVHRLEGAPMRLPDEVPESWMIAAMRSEIRAL